MKPASIVIEKCGGVARVAEITGRSTARIYRWMHEKARGGTGGLIPAECQQVLMEHARRHGLPLAAEDFFRQDVTAPRDDAAAWPRDGTTEPAHDAAPSDERAAG